MRRWFNTAGPCNPADHYMLPPEERLPGVRDLIDRKAYFVLHAPRQIGKTTSLLTLAQALTREGRYLAILVSMEVGAPFPEDPGAAELAVLAEWRRTAGWQLPVELRPPPFPDAPPGQRVGAALGAWAQAAPRPLVVFLDEIDALRDTTLISVLRQLRSGYPGRPHGFPHALALIGLRDVRDDKIAAGGGDRLGTSSPFNINGALPRDRAAPRLHGLPPPRRERRRHRRPRVRHRPGQDGPLRSIELKVWRDGRPDPLAEGLAQLDEYLAGLELQRGWLILFDQRSGQPPIAERTRRERALTPAGREVAVIRA
ncbi:hypothetical protein WMF21_31650 [Sorangium sp. So ce1099]